jgi:hypothetical protein
MARTLSFLKSGKRMKSTAQQLKSRGFITARELAVCGKKDETAIIALLHNSVPWKRTAGVKMLAAFHKEKHIPYLCNLLENEKKLYTKLAISQALEGYGAAAIKYLLPLLGRIGKNQHKTVKLVDLNKSSFPLPRDIVARILIRIGPVCLAELENVLESGSVYQISEAIDAIGHIARHFLDRRSEPKLFTLLEKYKKNDLLTWKIIRAFQSFPSNRVRLFLSELIRTSDNCIFIAEAKRSLERIEKG